MQKSCFFNIRKKKTDFSNECVCPSKLCQEKKNKKQKKHRSQLEKRNLIKNISFLGVLKILDFGWWYSFQNKTALIFCTYNHSYGGKKQQSAIHSQLKVTEKLSVKIKSSLGLKVCAICGSWTFPGKEKKVLIFSNSSVCVTLKLFLGKKNTPFGLRVLPLFARQSMRMQGDIHTGNPKLSKQCTYGVTKSGRVSTGPLH